MRPRGRRPVWIPEGAPPEFPDPSGFDAQGLIAGGGDLTSARLLAAYRGGLFPWYDEPPILWWSPDPRAIISPGTLHVSRSLAQRLRSGGLTVTAGSALALVMRGCAEREEGTWLTGEMQAAYLRLGELGHALSYEVWEGTALVGGLYGVLVDGLFAAESKFHRATDASKVALVCAVTDLFARGAKLMDVQFVTSHLATLGVHEVSREDYLKQLREAASAHVIPPPAGENLLPGVLAALRLGSSRP